jgi:hypothetical protein
MSPVTVMPAPPEVVDSVVQSTVEDHARRQSRVAYAAAFLFFVNAGLSDDELNVWLAAYLPWQREAVLEAAQRGWTYASLLWSLETDNAPDGLAATLEDSSFVADVLERGERFADRPVVRARWEASQIAERRAAAEADVDVDVSDADVEVPTRPSTLSDVRPEVESARQAATRARLTPAPSRRESTLAESMQRGAARAAEQAMADTNQAFGAGMDEFASQPGRQVKRWLKAPHARACNFCFLVSTRGYRTAAAAMRAGHLTCKCGAKAVWVTARPDRDDTPGRRRTRQAEVSNWYWRQELENRGYGLLFEAGRLSDEGRQALVGELFPDLDIPARA